MYEIIYDFGDEKNIVEKFKGNWSELQDYLKKMKNEGCYNIDAAAIYKEEDYGDE